MYAFIWHAVSCWEKKKPQAGMSDRQPQPMVTKLPLFSYSSKYVAYDKVSLKKECEKFFNREVWLSESKCLEEQTRLQSVA